MGGRRWQTSSAGYHPSSEATLTVLSPSIFHHHNIEDADDHNDDGYENDFNVTVNLTTLLINHNQRDIGVEFLAQLGGDELQEILKEAGITNAVHR